MAEPPAGFEEIVAGIADDVLFAQALDVDERAKIPASHGPQRAGRGQIP